MANHGGKQALHSKDIVVEVVQRLNHAFGHEGTGGKMQDAVNPVIGEYLVKIRGIADIALVKRYFAGNGLAMAGQQIVYHNSFTTIFKKGFHIVRTYITRAARNQNGHNNPRKGSRPRGRPPASLLQL